MSEDELKVFKETNRHLEGIKLVLIALCASVGLLAGITVAHVVGLAMK
jgi:hypothetical protein